MPSAAYSGDVTAVRYHLEAGGVDIFRLRTGSRNKHRIVGGTGSLAGDGHRGCGTKRNRGRGLERSVAELYSTYPGRGVANPYVTGNKHVAAINGHHVTGVYGAGTDSHVAGCGDPCNLGSKGV